MRIKLLIFLALLPAISRATDYTYPGNAVAPLALENNDTLTVNSGVFDGGSSFAVMNSTTTSGQSVTIANGATISSSTNAIYGPADGPFTINNSGTISGTTAAVMASGSYITLNQNSSTVIDGVLHLGAFSTTNFNSSAGSNGDLFVGPNSKINFNSTGSPANGITGASSTTVNVNHTITLAPIEFISTLNINSGTATLGDITSLSDALNVASGATLALGTSTISGTATINQAGTFTSTSTTALLSHTGIFNSSGTTTIAGQVLNDDFRVSAGTTTITGVGAFTINNVCTVSGGTLDAGQTFLKVGDNATLHQTGGTLAVNSSGGAGSFQLGDSATYIIDGGTFNRGSAGTSTWSNNSTFQINAGTVNWQNEITSTNAHFVVTGGTFNYTAPGPIIMNGGTSYQTGGSLICSSTGGIFANPNVVLYNLGGVTFFNTTLFVSNNVTINVAGQPDITLNNGVTFLSNVNVNLNIAFGYSSLPLIKIPNGPADFSNPVVNITNNNNVYVAPGNYPFILAGGLITVGTLNLPTSNQFVQYSVGHALTSSGLEAYVTVQRTGLNNLATGEFGQTMGLFLEQAGASLGSSNSNTLLAQALTALQNNSINNLDAELFELSPQLVTAFPLITTVDVLLQQINTRLLLKRSPGYYAAGDTYFKNDFWIAPFGYTARQDTEGFLAGFDNKSGGLTIGLERNLQSDNTLGIAASYINSRVKPTENVNSHTIMNTYQITGYGTYNFKGGKYLDWLLAYNASFNNSKRSIDIVNALATAKYKDHQYAAKATFSQDVHYSKNLTVSPELNALYVQLHQTGYTESGAGNLDYTVLPTNTSLFRIGAGGWVTFLQQYSRGYLVPQAYAAITYDISAASQNISANLVSTTPVFSIEATQPRLGGIFGGKFTLKLNNRLNCIADVNVQYKLHYIEKYGELRFQYYF